jgi:hypothetical protein
MGMIGCARGLPNDRLPQSTASLPVPEVEATVTVDPSGTRVNGELVGAGGAKTEVGRALAAIADAVRARASTGAASRGFRGAVALEVAASLPSVRVGEAVEAAALGGFGQPWLVVVGAAGDRRAIRLALPEVALTEASREQAEGEAVAGSWANPRITFDPAVGVTVRVHDRVVDTGDGLVLACASTPCGAAATGGWPWVELNRLARRVKLDHPRDRAVMIAPDAAIDVQTFVSALDATRDDAVVARGDRELFPVVQLVDDGSGR